MSSKWLSILIFVCLLLKLNEYNLYFLNFIRMRLIIEKRLSFLWFYKRKDMFSTLAQNYWLWHKIIPRLEKRSATSVLSQPNWNWQRLTASANTRIIERIFSVTDPEHCWAYAHLQLILSSISLKTFHCGHRSEIRATNSSDISDIIDSTFFNQFPNLKICSIPLIPG